MVVEKFNASKNTRIVLAILFFDLVSFSLLFPAIPKILKYYSSQTLLIDYWFIYLVDWISASRGEWIQEFHSSEKAAIVVVGGILGSIYSLLQFIVNPIWGRLSDIFGRRKILLATSFSVMSAYLIWFFSNSFTLFLVSRILAGVSAGNLSVGTAAVADMSTPKDRTKSMGMIGAVFGLGFLCGPPIGGFAISLAIPEASQPFAALPLISFLLSAVGVLLAWLFFRETLPKNKSKQQATSSIKKAPFKTVLLAVLRSAFGARSEARQVFKTYIQRGNHNLRHLFIGYFFYIFIYSCYELTFTFFFDFEFGFTPLQIGMLFLYVGFVLILTQGVLVRILRRYWQTSYILILGLCCSPIPLFFLGYEVSSFFMILLFLLVITCGRGLSDASFTSLTTLLVEKNQQGSILSLFRSTNALARAFGPIFGAVLYFSVGAQYCYMILSILLAVHVAIYLPKRPKIAALEKAT